MERNGIRMPRYAALKDGWRRWRGDPLETDLAPYMKVVARIRALDLAGLDDAGLRERAEELRRRAGAGTAPDELLVETYALVREAVRRALGLEPFENQLVAGIALQRGRMVELPTGEGKTLAAVFPVCLHALAGRGAHVFTANDYLARRDAAWMGPVYAQLGLRAACVQEGMTGPARREAYGADVTYLAAREAGFDYLRDHLCLERGETVQRAFHFALVDEADFILIDEARVPLVIAGEARQAPLDRVGLARLASRLQPESDFQADEHGRNAFLTEAGNARVEAALGCGNLYDPGNQLLLTGVNLALHARALLRRDVDYIVRAGAIEIVDEFTGRVAERRRWPDGIQQAVEAKEGLAVRPEGTVLGSVTLQHFVRLYPLLCGMTATARQAAAEFRELYGMNTTVVPPHAPCRRHDLPDRVFVSRQAKRQALLAEIRAAHAVGRPVLVGTASVSESEALAGDLAGGGIACRVLNARHDEEEAVVVAEAGALRAVTISTNMAGRGTDIRLGGADGRDRAAVAALGGLYVIGTNRHESRRIDLQLRGRAGRQGDPGASRFFVSLDDDLLARYGIGRLAAGRGWEATPGGLITGPRAGADIAHCQRVIEGQNAEIRRTLQGYTGLLEEQRRAVCRRREELLDAPVEPGAAGAELERRVALFQLDRLWSEHLAVAADIRENIHLFRLSGQLPLEEFQARVRNEFCRLEKRWNDAVAATLAGLGDGATRADLDAMGVKGPSSTWVYLVNDNPFSEMYSFLISARHIGFAALAPFQLPLLAPLLLPLLLLRKLKRGLAGKAKAALRPGNENVKGTD